MIIKLTDIKSDLKVGDGPTIKDLSGYSESFVKKVLAGLVNENSPGAQDILKTAKKIITLRKTLKRSERKLRPYNRKSKAS